MLTSRLRATAAALTPRQLCCAYNNNNNNNNNNNVNINMNKRWYKTNYRPLIPKQSRLKDKNPETTVEEGRWYINMYNNTCMYI